MSLGGWEYVEDASAHGKLAAALDHVHAGVCSSAEGLGHLGEVGAVSGK